MIGKWLSKLKVMHRHTPTIKQYTHGRAQCLSYSFIDFNGSSSVLLHPVMQFTCTVEWVLLFWDLINVQIKH